ncbi:MAG: DUF4403 family protein [Acidobacteriota bacterium]
MNPTALLLMLCLSTTADSISQATVVSQPLSTIDIPVVISLAPLARAIESQVPKGVNHLEEFERDPSGSYGARYSVERGTLAVKMRGPILTVTTPIQYGFEACRRTRKGLVTGEFTMWPCVSCGLGDEVRRQVQLSLRSQVSVRPDWRVVTKTSATTPVFRNRCDVTAFKVDVTDWKIAPWIEQQLASLARSVDRNVPRMSELRKTAASIWIELQKPVALSPRVWLILQPQEVHLTPPDGQGGFFAMTIGVRARPLVIAGDQPRLSPMPLPNAGAVLSPASAGLSIPFEVVLPFQEASAMLASELVGTKRIGDREITINSVKLSEGTEGSVRLRLAVRFKQALLRTFTGEVELRGTPFYNAATGELELKDLDYTLDPKARRALFRVSDALYHDVLRTQLARSAKWPVKARLDGLAAEIGRSLHRPLGNGARLAGNLTGITPQGVTVTPDGIAAGAIAYGNAVIVVTDWTR